MTFTQLCYVIEVSETGSINRAANNMFVSQSALSTAILSLEKELGKAIFIRTNQGVLPTPFGKMFIYNAKPIVQQIRMLNQFIETEKQPGHVSLVIASSGWSFISILLSQLFEKYKSAGIDIKYYEAFGDEPIEMLADGLAELGFIRRYTCYHSVDKKRFQAKKIQFFPVYRADIGVTVGKANPLFYNDSDCITPDMLKNSVRLVHNYLDTGLYSDIFEQLHFPHSPNHFLVTSRASMYELIGKIDSYYLNSVFSIDGLNSHNEDNSSPRRTLILRNCEIKSEFGWIKKEDNNLSSIALDAISIISDYFSSSI